MMHAVESAEEMTVAAVRGTELEFGRIVVLEIQVPNLFVNPVW
jgi:hypothetical protein